MRIPEQTLVKCISLQFLPRDSQGTKLAHGSEINNEIQIIWDDNKGLSLPFCQNGVAPILQDVRQRAFILSIR
jgi:hypothetical protein